MHDRPVPLSAIEMFLDLLRSAHGDKLLRMKGIIELAEDPERPLVIHGVQTHPASAGTTAGLAGRRSAARGWC